MFFPLVDKPGFFNDLNDKAFICSRDVLYWMNREECDMEMDMQRLNPGMMARYEIENHRPARVNAVQFGAGEVMLSTVDRLIDDARLDIGIACVDTEDCGHAGRLGAQEGLYTLVIRGYVDEEPLRREQVVQCILSACAPEGVEALARDPAIRLAIADDTPGARASASRFADLRRKAGLPEVPVLQLNDNMLADSLAFRSEPDEAARECATMNYLDEMLHLAEPYARLTVCMPPEFREAFPLDRVGDVRFVDAAGLERAKRLKTRVFDAGLMLMAAAGWLNGCDTFSDCMKHERLRRYVGEGFTGEIMPALEDIERPALERAVIESFARYENPLNRNRILRCAAPMIARFRAGALPMVKRLAEANDEPPRRLSFALAATIMLYAGARMQPDADRYQVARGSQAETLHDDNDVLEGFAALSHDMPPESLAYAALADRELWGEDLRRVEGLEARVALDIAAMQREPRYLPE